MKYDCQPYQECWSDDRCRKYGWCIIGYEARRLANGGITFTKDGSLVGISIPASKRIDAESQFPTNKYQLTIDARM